MISFAIGLLIVGHRRLREPSWRLMRKPGLLACLMALVATLISLSIRTAAMRIEESRGFAPLPGSSSYSMLVRVSQSSLSGGGAILFGWTTLLVTGAWRPSPDWIDRAGRLLGLAWIMLWASIYLGL
jgi:hypothetical protein